MRLSQIRHILGDAIVKFDISRSSIANSPNVTLQNIHEAIAATRSIQTTGILKAETAAVLGYKEIAISANDEIVVHGNTASGFISATQVLVAHTKVVLQSLEELLGEEEPYNISIKLPQTTDIDRVAKDLATLKLALDQALVNPYIDGHIELISFERGTNWIDVSVGGMIAFQFLAGMVRLIYNSRNKEIELEAKREMVRHIKMQNELKEKVLEAIDTELEVYYAESVDSLLSTPVKQEFDPEYRGRLAHSLRLLSGLLTEGLEVHPALITSDSKDDVFPDTTKLVEALKALPDTTINTLGGSGNET